MAVDPLRVVLLEPEVERGDRRHRPGDADRPLGLRLRQQPAHVLADRADILAEALGHPHAADVEALAHIGADDLHLGRAAADVDDERSGLECADAAQRQLGLLVAAQAGGS